MNPGRSGRGWGRQMVRRRGLAVIAAAAIALGPVFAGAGASVGAGQTADVACDTLGCISLSKLSSEIGHALRTVVGFVAIVGGLPPVSSGSARTSADPPATVMGPDLPINIASVTKVLTTIAVLYSLRQHNHTLDDTISPYLYSDWRRGPLIDTITFRMLLTHTSGFRACDKGKESEDYDGLKSLIDKGVKQSDINAPPEYSNCNFAIFREMLPQMEGTTIGAAPDSLRAQESAAYYIQYVNQHVLTPVGVQQRVCRAPKSPNDIPGYPWPAILSYPMSPGSTHGEDWGDWTLACGGGGWVLTANDLFAVVNDLATGSVLLTTAEKMVFLAPKPNCIGWDCSLKWVSCPTGSVCKNGGLQGSPPQQGTELNTYAGVLKCHVPAVVIVNSPVPSHNDDLTPLVTEAVLHAKISGPAQPCPWQ